ncbi:MAG TPA: hypothetical protein VJ836_06820 [Candidatus Saccharimonadales bacterium]|nr:hypothetical protein [Candidatus Saccharimonadales bacterium]
MDSRIIRRYSGDFPHATEHLSYVPDKATRGAQVTGDGIRTVIANAGEVIRCGLLIPNITEIAEAAGVTGPALSNAAMRRGYNSTEAMLARVTGYPTFRHVGYVCLLPPAECQPAIPGEPDLTTTESQNTTASQLIEQIGPEAARALAQNILTQTQG